MNSMEQPDFHGMGWVSGDERGQAHLPNLRADLTCVDDLGRKAFKLRLADHSSQLLVGKVGLAPAVFSDSGLLFHEAGRTALMKAFAPNVLRTSGFRNQPRRAIPTPYFKLLSAPVE
jgi:hypothetical protein